MLGKDGRLYDWHYDYDGDGKLNTYESAVMDDYEPKCPECNETSSYNYETFDYRDKAPDYNDTDSDDKYRELELAMAGLNKTELEFMDEDERREALEDSGLDTDNYDFY